jgi:thiamine kinase-like enzyme
VLVSEYVSGRHFSAVTDRDWALVQIGVTLGALHDHTIGTEIHGIVSDAFTGTTWLFDQVERDRPDALRDFAWAMETLRRIQEVRGPFTPALLHADVSEGNVIFTGQGAFLIDWEYAGAGDRYYDVGDFSAKANLTDSETEQLVAAYCVAEQEQALAIVRCYRFVSMLRDGLWALRAGTTGFLDFDHAGYAESCLARMAEIAAEPAFEQALHLLDRAEKLR